MRRLLLLSIVAVGLTSCDNSRVTPAHPNTENPAMSIVTQTKQHDTAILLCTFGSTYEQPVGSYDQIVADYKAAFPNADVYLSFTSQTVVNRVHAETGIHRYQPDLWLEALGEAGYKKVAVQSLHVIPGEEYLNLMNGDVKKDFMIHKFPTIQVLRSECLLSSDEDVALVAKSLYKYYQSDLSNPRNVLLFMGHGNPDVNYNANAKYTEVEAAMNDLTSHRNVIVGTVDYGPTLFYPEEGAPNAECVYAKLMAYCKAHQLQPGEITVYLAPMMSIAGDHAHNDLWGREEGDDASLATPDSDACWRLKVLHMGFNVSEREGFNAQSGKSAILGLADHSEVRQVWLSHMTSKFDDPTSWQDGQDYQ